MESLELGVGVGDADGEMMSDGDGDGVVSKLLLVLLCLFFSVFS